MQNGRRVTEAVEKIEAGNGLESMPWKGRGRNSPDLDGGIATVKESDPGRRAQKVGTALIWTEGLRLLLSYASFRNE